MARPKSRPNWSAGDTDPALDGAAGAKKRKPGTSRPSPASKTAKLDTARHLHGVDSIVVDFMASVPEQDRLRAFENYHLHIRARVTFPTVGLVGHVFHLHQRVVARMGELSFVRAQLRLYRLLENHLPDKLYLGDPSYSDPSHILEDLKRPLRLFPAETAPYSVVMDLCWKIAAAKEELLLLRKMNELYRSMVDVDANVDVRPPRGHFFFEHDRPIDLLSLMRRWYHDESSTPQQYQPIYSGGSSSWMGENSPGYYS